MTKTTSTTDGSRRRLGLSHALKHCVNDYPDRGRWRSSRYGLHTWNRWCYEKLWVWRTATFSIGLTDWQVWYSSYTWHELGPQPEVSMVRSRAFADHGKPDLNRFRYHPLLPSWNPLVQRFQFNPVGLFLTTWGLRLLEVCGFTALTIEFWWLCPVFVARP